MKQSLLNVIIMVLIYSAAFGQNKDNGRFQADSIDGDRSGAAIFSNKEWIVSKMLEICVQRLNPLQGCKETV